MRRVRSRRAWISALIAGTWFGATGLTRAQETAPMPPPVVVATRPLTGGLPRSAESAAGAVIVRTILVRPREARPTFESPLFPSRDKLQRGSAAPIFLRQNFEATQALATLRETYQRGEAFKSLLEDLDVAAVRAGTPLRLNELRRAAFREQAGWEYPLHEERPAYILLPDVQESRLYSQALVLSARADIKEGKLADAADKICITLGLAKHIGETPFAVCRLVQKSHVDGALFAVEELLQHPDAANHYWSLSALPRPMIPVLDALQAESKMLAGTYPALAKPEAGLTEAEWKRLQKEVFDMLRSSGVALPPNGTPEGEEMLRAWVSRSRERLPQIRPEWRERVAAMSDSEVALRYWFERRRDRDQRLLAWAVLEPSLALPRLAAGEEELTQDAADEPLVRETIGGAASSLLRASTLVDQRIALLRTIEAIRDWSSRHGGKLPRSLQELHLPIPEDPVVDAPFAYSAAPDGKSATLEGALVESRRPGPSTNKSSGKTGYRYELKIAE